MVEFGNRSEQLDFLGQYRFIHAFKIDLPLPTGFLTSPNNEFEMSQWARKKIIFLYYDCSGIYLNAAKFVMTFGQIVCYLVSWAGIFCFLNIHWIKEDINQLKLIVATKTKYYRVIQNIQNVHFPFNFFSNNQYADYSWFIC